MIQTPLLLAIDQGTTSSRAILFAASGRPLQVAQKEFPQHYPRDGWVEHDPQDIWSSTLAVTQEVLSRAQGTLASIGITNQRETTVVWGRATGQPIHNAIVWQDRRTADQCQALRDAGHESLIQARTGLVIDPYFSATKMRWLIDHEPAVAQAGDALALGTVESWLVWNLTGGLHISDASNASRTQLLALDGANWDSALWDLFGVPVAALPDIGLPPNLNIF